MKKIVLFCFCLSVLLSCSKVERDASIDDNNLMFERLATKSDVKDYSVTKEAVYRLLCDRDVLEVICYPSNETPSLFIVRCNPGFFIIAADKRAYPIVAHSDSNDVDFCIEDAQFVLEEFSAPIREIKNSAQITDDMSRNVNFWDNITETRRTLTDNNSVTYYYLIESRNILRYLVNVGPLLQTAWGQSNKNANDHYWNNYCPWSYSSCTGSKSPVGCVAVAGGQFAYYMKDREGVSVKVPSYADCTGYVNHYTQYFSTYLSSTAINDMPLDYSCTSNIQIEHARVFLAYIGNQIGMNYGVSSSSASSSDLVSLFSRWGINSEYIDFRSGEVQSQVRRNIPVVVRGYDDLEESGHAWIIDGFQDMYYLRRNYMYVSNVALTEEQVASLTMADWNGGYEELIIPGDRNFHMNWGWNGFYDGWYSVDNWAVAGSDFSTNKRMIKVI